MSPDRDDDIRELLARRAADVEPQGTYADVERKLTAAPTAPAWHRRTLVAVAAVLALLFGAGVVALATSRDDDQGVVADEPGDTTTATTTPVTTAPPVPDTEVPPSIPATTPATDPAPTTTTAPATTTTTTPPTQPVTSASRVTLYGIDALEFPLTRGKLTELTGQELTPPSGDFVGSTCDYTRFVDGPADLSFMTDGDRVVRIDVIDGTTVRTVSGIGIGSTEAEVRATYPDADIRPGKYAGLDAMVTDADAPAYKLTMEINEGVVTGYRSGLAEFVDYPEGCA